MPRGWVCLEGEGCIHRVGTHSLPLTPSGSYLTYGCQQVVHSLLECFLIADSFRVSLFIDLGCPKDLGKGWMGDLGTLMISRPI